MRRRRLRPAQGRVHTREFALFGLDWADKQGEPAACRACGYVHSFADVSLLDWSTEAGPTSAQ